MAATKVSLKLLIDTKRHRVLFAEAGKDFVDFLFNILSLPIGTVVKLLTKSNMVGCLGNLYESIENLNETYIQPNQNKDSLLKPKAPSKVPLLLPNVESSTARQVYVCPTPPANVFGHFRAVRCPSAIVSGYSQCRGGYFADDPGAVCPNCNKNMKKKFTYVAPLCAKEDSTSTEGGYVKGVVTYMVMDDLMVTPMSTISTLTLLNKFKVKQVGTLKEKVIYLGTKEGVKLLKASLQSKTVLTNVFLGKKGKKGA